MFLALTHYLPLLTKMSYDSLFSWWFSNLTIILWFHKTKKNVLQYKQLCPICFVTVKFALFWCPSSCPRLLPFRARDLVAPRGFHVNRNGSPCDCTHLKWYISNLKFVIAFFFLDYKFSCPNCPPCFWKVKFKFRKWLKRKKQQQRLLRTKTGIHNQMVFETLWLMCNTNMTTYDNQWNTSKDNHKKQCLIEYCNFERILT